MPFLVHAASFVHEPETQRSVATIDGVSLQQEVYGELKGYPHTFEFVVKESEQLSVEVAVPKKTEYKKSLIVIKEERRGVSEVGRVSYDADNWQKDFDWRIGRKFLTQGTLDAELGEGVYRIEVSSPENLGKYKLKIGTKRQWGYFGNFAHAWTGARFFGSTVFSVLRAPIVLGTLLVVVGLWYWMRQHKRKKYDID